MFKRFALFIIFFSISEIAYAKCDFNTSEYINELNDLNNVRKIDVTTVEYKKWMTNSLRTITSKKGLIQSKHKKSVRARIQVTYDFGTWQYLAKVLQNGDHKDHIHVHNGKIIATLDVRSC